MDKCERIQPSCGEWPELEATARAALPEDEPRSLILYNINVTQRLECSPVSLGRADILRSRLRRSTQAYPVLWLV